MSDAIFDVPMHSVAFFAPVVSSFGGGLNSTALLVRMVIDGCMPPHRIIFADTGCERPDVYEHIERFSQWLVQQGYPQIEITRKGGRPETLEQYALRTKHLPSLAYGTKGCSWKFKIEPQERDVNRWPVARQEWRAGGKVVKLIGYGYEEQKRLAKAKLEDDKYFYRFPLNEWRMDREDCARVIERAGLPVPGKSSCFFCPASKKAEIIELKRKHPELVERAIRLEVVAREAGNMKTTRGLGRQFSWAEFLAGAEVPEAPTDTCMYCADDNGDSCSLPSSDTFFDE